MNLTAAILLGIFSGVGLVMLGYAFGRLSKLEELRAAHEREVRAWLRAADEGNRAIVALQTELTYCRQYIRELFEEDTQEEARWTEN